MRALVVEACECESQAHALLRPLSYGVPCISPSLLSWLAGVRLLRLQFGRTNE